MTRKCAFTICAKNYIGLARALEGSLRTHDPDVDFFIFVADEFDPSAQQGNAQNLILARTACDLRADEWRDMSFKYDLVEFCTSIKPFCMQALVKRGYDDILYFDPDILVFAPLTPIFDALETHKAVATPHRLQIENDMPSRGGVYNLGFLGVRAGPATDRMLRWWEDRLRNHCSADPMRGYFTDQKWMDYLPVVYDNGELFVTRQPGLNFAPFNFDEREAFVEDGAFHVRMRQDPSRRAPLVFLHFSAMRYKEIATGDYAAMAKAFANREPAVLDLIRIYGKAIAESGFLKSVSQAYSYATYSDGRPVEYSHRRIFKRLREEKYDLGDPFDASGKLRALVEKSGMLTDAPVSSDKVRVHEVENLSHKIRLIDIAVAAFIRLFGYARFNMLARFMIRYLHPSNRARLLGGEFRKLTIEMF